MGSTSQAWSEVIDGLRPSVTDGMTGQQGGIFQSERLAEGDPYAAQGIDAGAFRVFPTLRIGTVATSNVASSSSDAEADLGLRINPGLRLESDWVRHQLTASASGETVRYLEHDELSTANVDAEASLRLDIRRTTRAEIGTSYELTSTGASDSEVPDTATGVRLDQAASLSTALVHDFGGVEARLEAELNRKVYGDVDLSGGGEEDNGDRDYTELALSARATFNPDAIIRPFIELSYAPRIRDRKFDRNGLERSSKGYEISAGLLVDRDPLWSGLIAATYLVRDYDDSSLDTVSAPGLTAQLVWHPTDMTRLELSAIMGLDETATAASAATRTWSADTRLTHALRDNLDLIAGAGLEVEDTQSGIDYQYTARLGLDWMLNPMVSWSASYDGTWFDGAAAANNYVEHQLLAAIVLKR